MNKKNLQWMLLCLVVATFVALAWNQYGMNSVLVINAKSNFDIHSIDDRSAGGKTESVLTRENEKLILDCEIRAVFQWPFCEISVQFAKVPNGLDLTHYDTMRIWAKTEGPAKQEQLRIFLRNFNPAYSKVEDPLSMKPQEIAYAPTKQGYPLEVDLSQFTVASWWSNARDMPMKHVGNELSNVVVLGVSSGGYVEPGKHKITVDRIELQGKLIRPEVFRLAIISVWLLVAIVYLLADVIATRTRLASSTLEKQSLKRMNDGLRVQSKAYERLARTDALTGALNRTGMSDQLMRLSSRNKPLFPLSLIFIDVDHFKLINDKYGHEVGDQVLSQLADLVKSNIQRGDLLVRWGGEEFLVICRQCHANNAGIAANRLRNLIEARQWPQAIHVTASFGVAEWIAGEDITDSIKRADEAMYRAKQEGRNRVEVQNVAQEEKAAEEQ